MTYFNKLLTITISLLLLTQNSAFATTSLTQLSKEELLTNIKILEEEQDDRVARILEIESQIEKTSPDDEPRPLLFRAELQYVVIPTLVGLSLIELLPAGQAQYALANDLNAFLKSVENLKSIKADTKAAVALKQMKQVEALGNKVLSSYQSLATLKVPLKGSIAIDALNYNSLEKVGAQNAETMINLFKQKVSADIVILEKAAKANHTIAQALQVERELLKARNVTLATKLYKTPGEVGKLKTMAARLVAKLESAGARNRIIAGLLLTAGIASYLKLEASNTKSLDELKLEHEQLNLDYIKVSKTLIQLNLQYDKSL